MSLSPPLLNYVTEGPGASEMVHVARLAGCRQLDKRDFQGRTIGGFCLFFWWPLDILQCFYLSEFAKKSDVFLDHHLLGLRNTLHHRYPYP